MATSGEAINEKRRGRRPHFGSSRPRLSSVTDGGELRPRPGAGEELWL
jgi:hypothetical protein